MIVVITIAVYKAVIKHKNNLQMFFQTPKKVGTMPSISQQ